MERTRIKRDLVILAVSILFAVFLVRSGAVHTFVNATDNPYAASFVAGMFFTSVVTTAPAVVVLTDLGGAGDILSVALVAAVGAVLVEFVLFMFLRERFERDLLHMLSRKRRGACACLSSDRPLNGLRHLWPGS